MTASKFRALQRLMGELSAKSNKLHEAVGLDVDSWQIEEWYGEVSFAFEAAIQIYKQEEGRTG